MSRSKVWEPLNAIYTIWNYQVIFSQHHVPWFPVVQSTTNHGIVRLRLEAGRRHLVEASPPPNLDCSGQKILMPPRWKHSMRLLLLSEYLKSNQNEKRVRAVLFCTLCSCDDWIESWGWTGCTRAQPLPDDCEREWLHRRSGEWNRGEIGKMFVLTERVYSYGWWVTPFCSGRVKPGNIRSPIKIGWRLLSSIVWYFLSVIAFWMWNCGRPKKLNLADFSG